MFEDGLDMLGGAGGPAAAANPWAAGLSAVSGMAAGGPSSASTGGGDRMFSGQGDTYFAPPTAQVQAQSWVQAAPWIALAVLALLYLVSRKR